jgi:hypothetical protein
MNRGVYNFQVSGKKLGLKGAARGRIELAPDLPGLAQDLAIPP